MTASAAGRDPRVRERLLADRGQAESRVRALTEDLDGIVQSSSMVATDDEHDPEGATVAFERAQTQALLDQAREHLESLDVALARWERGTYGVCERCGRPIGQERLEARPDAVRCIDCAAAAD